MAPATLHTVIGIDLVDVIEQYHRRRLDELSDTQLIRQVANLVARPRRDPADSFVLHAPLELAARAALLTHIAPNRRELARQHIVAIAAQYEAFGPALGRSNTERGAARASISSNFADDLVKAIAGGDLDETDNAAAEVGGSMTPIDLATTLVDVVIPLTAAAAHAPIFLNQLLRRDPRGGITGELLRPLARDLARNPGWRIAWTDSWTPRHPTDPNGLLETIATATPRHLDGPPFIHPMINSIDASGVAADVLGNVVGTYDAKAAKMLIRSAAMSMLQDDPEHAPYGWTHTLTIPQAVLALAPLASDPHRSLAVAATQVMAFRAALSKVTLDPHQAIEESNIDPVDLATAAAVSHDAHVVKYTVACFDAAADDPAFARLYLSAARRLLDVWAERGGDPTDPVAR